MAVCVYLTFLVQVLRDSENYQESRPDKSNLALVNGGCFCPILSFLRFQVLRDSEFCKASHPDKSNSALDNHGCLFNL